MPSSRPGPPYDLVAILAITLALGGVLIADPLAGSPVRAALALVFMLFIPGYTVVAFLFPKGGTPNERSAEREVSGHIELADRFVLSFAISVAFVILVGLVLGIVERIEPVPVYLSLASITALGAVAAAVRRHRVPPAERFAPGVHARRAYVTLFAKPTKGGNLLNALFFSVILIAAAGVGYGVPGGSELRDAGYTEFYLLPNETGDQLEPDDYPSSLDHADGTPFTVGIQNREGERVTYTLVVLLQRTTRGDDPTVIRESELHREQVTLQHNQAREISHQIVPTFTGEDLRLAYLLYADTDPQAPSNQDAYRELHLWVDVPGSGEATLGHRPLDHRQPGITRDPGLDARGV